MALTRLQRLFIMSPLLRACAIPSCAVEPDAEAHVDHRRCVRVKVCRRFFCGQPHAREHTRGPWYRRSYWVPGSYAPPWSEKRTSLLKVIEKEGLQGGKGDNNWVGRHRHIHDPGIQQERDTDADDRPETEGDEVPDGQDPVELVGAGLGLGH